ncbi:hypothetical protein EV424DRAFT_1558515 [Suillus variegatus]|nr:hypothetical protein EV424DRAFT_1558515 [Suillus variegatus]
MLRRIARYSLAGLSCVYRFFKDTALDVLWAELENMDRDWLLEAHSPMPDLWTDTTCFQVSGGIHDWTFSNYTRHLLKSLGLLFSLWFLYGNPETALNVERALRKLDNHSYHSRLDYARLKRLALGTAHFLQTQFRIMFRGLVTLLSCPNIESLGMAFDTTNVGAVRLNIYCALVPSQILLCLVKLEAEPWTWGANQEARRTKAEQGVRLYWSLCLDRIAGSICLTL